MGHGSQKMPGALTSPPLPTLFRKMFVDTWKEMARLLELELHHRRGYAHSYFLHLRTVAHGCMLHAKATHGCAQLTTIVYQSSFRKNGAGY